MTEPSERPTMEDLSVKAGKGLVCPHCKAVGYYREYYTRKKLDGRFRRHRCLNCNCKFSTMERVI